MIGEAAVAIDRKSYEQYSGRREGEALTRLGESLAKSVAEKHRKEAARERRRWFSFRRFLIGGAFFNFFRLFS